MRPKTNWWGLVLTLVVGLGAGLWAADAAAQDDQGSWFDDESSGEPPRPQLRIHGSGPYDPPPADFRSDPPRENWQYDDAADASDDVDASEDDPDAQTRALSEFSPHLSAYGHWVDDPVYGRVWVPTRSVVGPDFSPYVSGGHWELTTDDAWFWASDYPFGWITFHYGRWVWASDAGWAWVPGYRYAPAWVDFRVGSSGYIGWGPAPAFYAWRGGVFVQLGVRRPIPFIFCPTTYVFSHSVHRHVIRDRHRVHAIAADTWRYRPRYRSDRGGRVAGYVRGPSPSEARIPRRAVPVQRTIARPRLAEPPQRSSRASFSNGQTLRPSGRSTLREPSYSRRNQPPNFGRSLSTDSSVRGAERAERASSRRLGSSSPPTRRAEPRVRDARSREWFDAPARTEPRAAPRSNAQRAYSNRLSMPRSPNLERPHTGGAAPKARTPKNAPLPTRGAVHEANRSAAPKATRSSRGKTTTPRTQHRAERESRGKRR